MSEEHRKKGDPVLGAELKAIRDAAGLSQEELALKLGVTRAQISRVETGTRSTGVDLVRRWYRECGYELEGVEVGPPQQATSLAMAVADLPEGQLDAILQIVQAWPDLPERSRGKILGIVASHEA